MRERERGIADLGDRQGAGRVAAIFGALGLDRLGESVLRAAGTGRGHVVGQHGQIEGDAVGGCRVAIRFAIGSPVHALGRLNANAEHVEHQPAVAETLAGVLVADFINGDMRDAFVGLGPTRVSWAAVARLIGSGAEQGVGLLRALVRRTTGCSEGEDGDDEDRVVYSWGHAAGRLHRSCQPRARAGERSVFGSR